MPDHFLMAPSSSARWIKCPGSLRVPHPEDEGSEAAWIGSLGHAIVESKLAGRPPHPDDVAFYKSLTEDTQCQLRDSVWKCVEYVRSLEDQGVVFEYERKIASDLIAEHGGTVDVIVYWPDTKRLEIIDFKFGRLKVDAGDNTQLMSYVNLARQEFPDARRFFGTIIQPKIYDEPQTVEFSRDQLELHALNVLKASISDEFHAGDHCTFCPVLATCETAAKHSRDEASQFPDLTKLAAQTDTQPTEAEVEQLCRVYRAHKLAEAGSKAAGKLLKEWVKRGADIQTHGLGVRCTGRSHWTDDASDKLTQLGLSPDDYLSESLVSPAKLRDSLGLTKKQFEEKFAEALRIEKTQSLVIGKDYRTLPEFD